METKELWAGLGSPRAQRQQATCTDTDSSPKPSPVLASHPPPRPPWQHGAVLGQHALCLAPWVVLSRQTSVPPSVKWAHLMLGEDPATYTVPQGWHPLSQASIQGSPTPA